MHAKPFILSSILAVLISLCHQTQADDAMTPLYSAQGTLVYEMSTNGVRTSEQEWFFEVAEDSGGKWKMRLFHDGVNSEPHIDTTENITYDGTNIYSVVYSSKTLSFFDGQIKVLPNTNNNPARVCSGPYPIDHSSAAGTLWLAFFAGGSLDASKSQARIPNLLVSDARNDPEAWVCDFMYRVKNNGSSRPLLSSGEFYINTRYVMSTPHEYAELDEPSDEREAETFQTLTELLRAPSPNQLKRAAYSLTESTNLNGTLIPLKYEIEIANPLVLKNIQMKTVIHGQVTNLWAGSAQVALMPELKGSVTVQDRRLRAKAADNRWRREVFYAAANQRWVVDTNDAIIQAALIKKPWRNVLGPSHRKQKYALVMTLFVALVTLPAVVVIVRRVRKSHAVVL